MASSSDDDIVILIRTNPNPIESDIRPGEILISTANILSWDIPTILSHQKIKVQANQKRLIEQSSYFHGLLSGSFSESCLDFISIQWNPETFINILKCIYGCSLDVKSNIFLPFYEGALYFGVETLLLKCQSWLSEVSSSKGSGSPQIPLDDLIHIWNFGLEHANDFVPELCTSYLARNFMWAISSPFFGDVPYNLLHSCTRHPHLTVESEMHLSDALLVWLNANTEQLACLRGTENDCTDILNEIRISLLPLWFAAGKIRSCYFSKLANKSVASILSLMKNPSKSLMKLSGDGNFKHLRIRLTEYSKKVNISGCPQITLETLLLSLLPHSYSMDIMLRKSIKQSLVNLEHLDRDQYPILQGLLPTLSFEAVQEVDISKCSRLHLEAAIECFCKSFPSLRKLKAAYLLNFRTTTLHQLVQKCPVICEVDLTVDISPVIPAQVCILSSASAIMPLASNKSLNVQVNPLDVRSFCLSGAMLSNITKLTLKGRSDVNDLDLQYISRICVSLYHLNLKGCTSVTDAGMSDLICRCINLHSIIVCDTSFGTNSVLALCFGISSFGNFSAVHSGKKHLDAFAFKLQTLHMGGCKAVDETSLLELMSQTQMLKSLCLRDTHLMDCALYSFSGSSLEMLDVSNTMVSGASLTQIVRGNPGLKCLKARGCKNLIQQESFTRGGEYPSPFSWGELYFELGKACRMEEIAFGWGFSCFSLKALKPAITSLRTLNVGLGGSLGEDALILLPTTCPILESLTLYFQVISDGIMVGITSSLRHLRVLALCYCLGDISIVSFKFTMPNLRKLKLERVAPWMTNNDLIILTQNCANLIELSLLGCMLLNADTQQIISQGWPGLISVHIEDCGQVTASGVCSLFDCKTLEDLWLRHNGPGIHRNFILDAASKMPMLRKVSLDLCDASDGDFDIPEYVDRYFLSAVKIARCKSQRCALDLQLVEARRRPVHKETLVLTWNSKNLSRTVVKERL